MSILKHPVAMTTEDSAFFLYSKSPIILFECSYYLSRNIFTTLITIWSKILITMDIMYS